MLKTWKFWRTFFTTYLALVAGIWGFVEAYTYFEDDSLKQFFGSNWWIYYYVLPLFIAILVAVGRHSSESGEAETLNQRNRRVMLNHVENFWVKGILGKSLHGVALLDLGIKEDSSLVSYPWGIKRESTDETLPAGKPMLEIFEEIGAGRSLLILGAPGSGKTTMLIELARQLIERARNDETEPIPVVFNLASWTEKLSLADWLAKQLNIVYSVPKKTAPKWVAENKMLLLLDGLDEVKQDSREKCAEAINQFRNDHGLTSLAVCSRIEEYQEIKTRLLLEGAITLQPLTSKQVDAYFDRFGNSLANVRQLLESDEDLRELAETPLMLSIMTLAFKDKKLEELPAFSNKDEQRIHLFNTYINRMFEHPARAKNSDFTKPQTLHYLSYLARKMIQHNLITYQIEAMQPAWLENKNQRRLYKWIIWLIVVLFVGCFWLNLNLYVGLIFGLIYGLLVLWNNEINMVDRLSWSWREVRSGLVIGLIGGLIFWLIGGLNVGLVTALSSWLILGLSAVQIEETTHPSQHLKQTLINCSFAMILGWLIFGLFFGLINASRVGLVNGLRVGLVNGLSIGPIVGMFLGVSSLIQHYTLRFFLIKNGFLPQQLIPFLEYTVDLIFLRRVGGSYIFVHRTLMEHFAEMEVESHERSQTRRLLS